jgi:hypothetical protein
MNEAVRDVVAARSLPHGGSVEVLTRAELTRLRHWPRAFAGQRKDHRYYELVEDAIEPRFEHRYFAIRNGAGEICAIQPFFILDQDVLAGTSASITAIAEAVRRVWPRFLRMRTLMVGCAAGEGHLDGRDAAARASNAKLLTGAIVRHARALKAHLIVLKEFPAGYRELLECFRQEGFARVPSLPMVRLCLDYANFDDYMKKAIGRSSRSNLRRNLRAADFGAPIEMTVLSDITPIIDDVYPLYLEVYERAKQRFEKLTKEFLCGLGRRMPERTRFFVWRREGRVVAFTVCLIEGDAICSEYLGFDYSVALDLHLYFLAFRDIISWAIANGFKWYRSTGLNYDPKLRLGCLLDPLDLYVRHRSTAVNAVLRRIMPLLEPTRADPTLRRFRNHGALWGEG